MSILDDHTFALCLTHDVDRPYKTYQTVYNGWKERDPTQLLDLLPWREPYWQFQEIMRIEEELGVRSAFYFLNEKHLFRDKPVRTWVRPEYWKLFLGRYTLSDPAIRETIRALDEGGWEVGLHGSYESYRDRDRLRSEKETIEEVLGHRIWGGRQHYLNLERPETWRHYADLGLRYDTSLGSSTEYGFQNGYEPLRPFDDEFVVFPLTLMEKTLPDVPSSPELAWKVCEALLEEARENDAVMTVLWHPSYFSDSDYPNYGRLYRRLIERAQEMGAWVGPPADLYASLDHPAGTTGLESFEPFADDSTRRTPDGDERAAERGMERFGREGDPVRNSAEDPPSDSDGDTTESDPDSDLAYPDGGRAPDHDSAAPTGTATDAAAPTGTGTDAVPRCDRDSLRTSDPDRCSAVGGPEQRHGTNGREKH